MKENIAKKLGKVGTYMVMNTRAISKLCCVSSSIIFSFFFFFSVVEYVGIELLNMYGISNCFNVKT